MSLFSAPKMRSENVPKCLNNALSQLNIPKTIPKRLRKRSNRNAPKKQQCCKNDTKLLQKRSETASETLRTPCKNAPESLQQRSGSAKLLRKRSEPANTLQNAQKLLDKRSSKCFQEISSSENAPKTLSGTAPRSENQPFPKRKTRMHTYIQIHTDTYRYTQIHTHTYRIIQADRHTDPSIHPPTHPASQPASHPSSHAFLKSLTPS